MPRSELFDMAVNRAQDYAQRLGAFDRTDDSSGNASLERDTLHEVLELWYLKTRFAYRVPLDDVIEVLLEYPGPGHFWQGGPEGAWHEGENPRP